MVSPTSLFFFVTAAVFVAFACVCSSSISFSSAIFAVRHYHRVVNFRSALRFVPSFVPIGLRFRFRAIMALLSSQSGATRTFSSTSFSLLRLLHFLLTDDVTDVVTAGS